MLRSRFVSIVTPILILASLGPVAVVGADEPTSPSGSGEALLEALARVPDTPDTRSAMVSYLDQEAQFSARPGAAQPGSIEEALALLDSDDASADLWWAALMGSSAHDLLAGYAPMAEDWPERLGFDLLGVDRQIVFGIPPSDGSVLLGDFDPEAVADAFAARGYSSVTAGTRTLLCGAAGCDKGMDVDIANADRSLPFGAEIGRSEPVALSGHDLLNSADLEILEAMIAAADGEVPSLSDDPAYRGLALAADPATVLSQAMLLPAHGFFDLDMLRIVIDRSTAPFASVTELEGLFEPMPVADAVAVLDGATGTEQVVTIALAYGDEADAAAAADILPRRLETLPALSYEGTIAELLAAQGVTSVTASVVPAEEGTAAVARIELRAPLAGAEPDPETGRPVPSSRLYRLLGDLVTRRDTLWLVPVLPLE